MRFIYMFILLASVFLTLQNAQDTDYWENAPQHGTRIYTIYFTTDTGYAVSHDNVLFISIDNGRSWYQVKSSAIIDIKPNKFFWSGEIYCSVMKTADGGKNWVPYTAEMREHFCRVYFKDPNTGYRTAEEFLANVCKRIFQSIHESDTKALINHPQQCTEYYSNKYEGWALGWCLKDFMNTENLADLK